MKRAKRWLGWAAGLWAAAALAQAAPEPVVLTVLGTNFTARELGVETGSPANRLPARAILAIQSGILGAYVEKLDYEPTEAELKEYCRRSAPTPADMDAVFRHERPTSLSDEKIFESFWQDWQRDAEDPHGAMQMAAADLKQWKFVRALFERYGGRVYVDEFLVPGVPDAARAYLAEREAAGDFTIHAADLRERCWELLRTPSPVPLVAEAEGRAVLAEHPADRQRRHAAKSLREHMDKARAPSP